MSWSGKKVLVTGAAGFIGSHLCEALLDLGADVTALIRYSSQSNYGNLEFLDKNQIDSLNIISGNIEDASFVQESTKGKDIVFHLAALIGIPYSYSAPRSYLRTNVEGTLNLLEAIRKFPIESLVHTSTSEVYGTAKYVPIDEKHLLQAQSPYAASKIAADKFVDSYVKSFGIRAVTLRPFNNFGPRQSVRAVIPAVISQALSCPEIKIGDLEPVRDFLFVTDTVNAFLKAADSPQALGKTIHVGTGSGISISEVVSSVLKILNIKKPIIHEETRVRPKNSEVLKLVCSPDYARSVLGWEPTVSFEDGLRETVVFFEKHLES